MTVTCTACGLAATSGLKTIHEELLNRDGHTGFRRDSTRGNWMIAAHLPVQRPFNAKILIVDGQGNIEHRARSEVTDLLRPGDLVVANDAATLPSSLSGQHSRTGRRIEVRLAGRDALDKIRQFCCRLRRG